VQEVAGSNPVAPTSPKQFDRKDLSPSFTPSDQMLDCLGLGQLTQILALGSCRMILQKPIFMKFMVVLEPIVAYANFGF
jgi:hypothetical protein